jgi:hypothetical protein
LHSVTRVRRGHPAQSSRRRSRCRVRAPRSRGFSQQRHRCRDAEPHRAGLLRTAGVRHQCGNVLHLSRVSPSRA